MTKIKLLDNEIINQIAAGEIIERPGSALKEIVENSIDASAKNIDIFLKNGGKSGIIVEDDGVGLSKEDLQMCIKRHATSKLSDINLFNIKSYGFRGEAIPSIASVSAFSIESKGFGISVRFSKESEIFPSPIQRTKVCVEDLFSSLPVRLKFLKSEQAEFLNCVNIIENFALTRANTNFSLSTDKKTILLFKNDSVEDRLSRIFGREMFKKSIYFEESDDKMRVYGYLFHPMDNRYFQTFQKIFVNNRYVKDKIVSSAVKTAYKDLIPSGRYAIAAIFIEIDPFYVDVNISPTKSEIRFRDAYYTQKFLTDAISKNLRKFDRVAIDFNASYINKPKTIENENNSPIVIDEKVMNFLGNKPVFNENNFSKTIGIINQIEEVERKEGNPFDNPQNIDAPLKEIIETKSNFFGTAVCQIFNSYIISEKEDEIIIIDQHAVHEKITQTKILSEINSKNKQYLITSESIELTESQINFAGKIIDILQDCGFSIKIVQKSIIISAIPTVLNDHEAKSFIIDILSSNEEFSDGVLIIDIIKKKIANKACHNSIRFGRKLSIQEMNEIIIQMEKTDSIHQCNHHRPSFISISKSRLGKMFERN
ncbi:MAG: DNA mismatch repair endonuclease MutL [Holosporales bacterium]|jgi:DNA mismatch repair protein MutL|nr:DNA mismatch repair endonuclease MutL [Holosporales bacterium]